jgi:8-hydroxy-5-deazaflavin:NADPH oxidoreductase
MQKVRVGVLGSGDVGKVLAAGFASLGHEVTIGSRDPEKLREWASSSARVTAGTFADAAMFGDILVLATLGTGTLDAIKLGGVDAFDGKVVIDATNPLDFSKGMPPTLFAGTTDSLGEQVQRLIPKARVVKAFNTVGNAHMIHPQFPGGPPDMFLCGNDAEGKKIVSQICEAFGWGVVDIGGIEGSRYLEPMCMTWVLYGIRNSSWNHAFKLLRK